MNKILLSILFLVSVNATAGWSTSSGVVTKAYSNHGSHVIRTTITDDVCPPGHFWWPADDSDAKDMFALALAAFMAGKKVSVVYDKSALSCAHGDSAKITHMVIQ